MKSSKKENFKILFNAPLYACVPYAPTCIIKQASKQTNKQTTPTNTPPHTHNLNKQPPPHTHTHQPQETKLIQHEKI